MVVSIQIEPETGTAIVTCSGVLESKDAIQDIGELWTHPEWSGRSAIWDFREARIDVDPSEARGIARFILQHQPDPPPSRVAWVTQRDVDFGMARVFEVFRQDPATEFRVFRDYEEALSWVRSLGEAAT